MTVKERCVSSCNQRHTIGNSKKFGLMERIMSENSGRAGREVQRMRIKRGGKRSRQDDAQEGKRASIKGS